MALGSSQIYCLKSAIGELQLELPEEFVLGLRATVQGIEIEATSGSPFSSAIIVEVQDSKFLVKRSNAEKRYTDYVDCLNELLLQLVYALMRHLSGWALLHCSAVDINSENLIAFGNKKSGKSVWAFEQTLNGGTLLADDLLAWNTKRGEFLCFGMTTRLRRPLNQTHVEKLPKEAFIPGRSLAYLKRTHQQVAPIGHTFAPDRVVELISESHEVRPISLIKSFKRLEKGCISPEYYTH